MTLHPLINKDSSHYDTGKTTAIEEMEKNLTVTEMAGFCKANIFKYEYRKPHKGQKESDEIKIKSYVQYLVLLGECSTYKDLKVCEAYQKLNKTFSYR